LRRQRQRAVHHHAATPLHGATQPHDVDVRNRTTVKERAKMKRRDRRRGLKLTDDRMAQRMDVGRGIESQRRAADDMNPAELHLAPPELLHPAKYAAQAMRRTFQSGELARERALFRNAI